MAIQAFTGFETGDASEIVALASGFSVSSAVARTGTYALLQDLTGLSGLQAMFVESGLSVSTAHLRVAFRATLLGTHVAPYAAFVAGGATINITYAILSYSSGLGSLFLQVHYSDASDVDTDAGIAIPLVENSFYVLEVSFVASATIVWRLNGDIIFTAPSITAANLTNITFQGVRTTDVEQVKVYWDDYARGDARVGIGRCIARQGKAGAPNADAWTKTGGASAATVWSETPYSATNEAHSTAASQAQTMLVADINAGVHPIQPRDTINACKHIAIMKEIGSGTTRTYSMRRRLNGSNTDTAKTLTATDAVYDTGIWTDTYTNLRSAEIGGVRGTGTGRHMQIEDCWLMVDYTPIGRPLSTVIGQAVKRAAYY